MAAEVQTIPAPVAPTTDGDKPEIAHTYCCKDPSKAHFLCGKIDPDSVPALPTDPRCVPCEVAAGTEFCPMYGRCIDPEINEEASN